MVVLVRAAMITLNFFVCFLIILGLIPTEQRRKAYVLPSIWAELQMAWSCQLLWTMKDLETWMIWPGKQWPNWAASISSTLGLGMCQSCQFSQHRGFIMFLRCPNNSTLSKAQSSFTWKKKKKKRETFQHEVLAANKIV